MDLDAPPPSYEVATGVSGAQQPLNPHFSRATQSSPSAYYDEEVKTVVSTTPIFPQSHHSRPTSYPAIRISPQTNNLLRRPQSKSSSKTCICFFTLLMLVITLILILVLVIKNSKPKATIYINTQSSDDTKYDEIRDWEAKLRQNNLDMFNRLDLWQKRRDESKWNFNTHQDND